MISTEHLILFACQSKKRKGSHNSASNEAEERNSGKSELGDTLGKQKLYCSYTKLILCILATVKKLASELSLDSIFAFDKGKFCYKKYIVNCILTLLCLYT